MSSRVAYYVAAFAVILTNNMIFATEKCCVEGIEQLRVELKQQIQGIRDLLTESSKQTKSQLDTVVKSLQAVDQRLRENDISMNNLTLYSWKLAIGLPVQEEIVTDLGEGPVLLPIVSDWIVLMHRFDGSLNFNRNWKEYRNGFGDIGRGEFWLGNEIVHRLTNGRGLEYSLRVEVQLKTSARWLYADYATFSLDSENNYYAIRLSGFSGNAGDSLTNTSAPSYYFHGGMSFSTGDNDNDNDRGAQNSCAEKYEAGWWFNNCWYSCLTCKYGNRFVWASLSYLESEGLLRAARMLIKSK